VMTASVEDLFELARRYNRPVLEMVVAGRQTYAVEEGGTWYGCYLGRSGDAADADPSDMHRDGIDPFEEFPPAPFPRRPPEAEPSQG
jgi:hypothetical protein